MAEDDHIENSPYQGVGRELRDIREAQGLRLEDVAADLRIQLDFLEALEAGRYKDLPGAAYAVGFLRTYASRLGMDAGKVVEEFKEEQAIALQPKPLNFPQPVERSRRPSFALVLLLLILVLAGYGGWWFYQQSGQTTKSELVPAVPSRLAALAKETPTKPVIAEKPIIEKPTIPQQSAPLPELNNQTKDARTKREAPGIAEADNKQINDAPKAVVPKALVDETNPANVESSKTTQNIDTAKSEADVVQTPTPETAVPTPVEEPAVKTEAPNRDTNSDQDNEDVDTAPVQPQIQQALKQSQAEAPAPPVAPTTIATATGAEANATAAENISTSQTFGAANKDGRIVLLAREDSWIQVRSRTNELLFTQLLRSGDRYMVPNRDDLLLTTGNAGGLTILVDGKVTLPLGKIGKVSRDIALQPAKLLPQ